MHPISVLKNLLRAAGAALLALPLAAQSAPASPEICAPAGVEKTARSGAPAASPIGEIHAHLCGFHFYSGDLKRSLRVEHYCSHLNPDVFQCIIYDSDRANARLIGIEYIISEKLFAQLPADEKPLWHSHRYEVMSGLLTAPGLAAGPEKELMRELVNTYGKTWHLWQVDRGDAVPLGLPKLMMGFTADGQASAQMVAERDREQQNDTIRVKARRADLPARPVAPGADAWQHEPAFQLSDEVLTQPRATREP